jgi:hypothetical protein
VNPFVCTQCNVGGIVKKRQVRCPTCKRFLGLWFDMTKGSK